MRRWASGWAEHTSCEYWEWHTIYIYERMAVNDKSHKETREIYNYAC